MMEIFEQFQENSDQMVPLVLCFVFQYMSFELACHPDWCSVPIRGRLLNPSRVTVQENSYQTKFTSRSVMQASYNNVPRKILMGSENRTFSQNRLGCPLLQVAVSLLYPVRGLTFLIPEYQGNIAVIIVAIPGFSFKTMNLENHSDILIIILDRWGSQL